jgi:tetratricopeptide (TPR) repeat protein
MPDSQEIKAVMISSTSLDLPQHRDQVVEACLRQGMFPIDMKYLPARDVTPLAADHEMIDRADVYIGIYAFHYGSVAEGEEKSYTELEFEHAVARGISCLIFLMSAEHVPPGDVETTPGAQEKLAAFKARASKGRIRKEFKSAEDLRSQVIDALSQWKRDQQCAADEKPAPGFHPPSNIPKPPKPYVAHPYSFLQTPQVVGRREELKLLTDWIKKSVPKNTRIFSVVAIGGMGKSALTWKWFNDIAPNELPNLEGRLWWSFYESDAHWENFVIRALAYTAGMPEAEARKLSRPEREGWLLRLLDERPFLLVLDGLERILLAYARMDAAHLLDDNLDQQTANAIARASGLPDDVRRTYPERRRLRQCADLRADAFLRKLARARASHVLVSTRLYPAALEGPDTQPLPGCYAHFLSGLTDDDALALWRDFINKERSGTGEQLLPLFRAFGNHPLLLRVLAGEVARYRKAPGDFDRWSKDNSRFTCVLLSLKNEEDADVLGFALRSLGQPQYRVLQTLAAFRMPTMWETLQALLVGEGRSCRDDGDLDAILTELEDRGFVGWDKKTNRYDLHPIVRGVVWAGLDAAVKRTILDQLNQYFEAAPKVNDWHKVKALEDLTPAIELYYTLIGLKRFDDAFAVFNTYSADAMLIRLSDGRKRIEMLKELFPNGLDSDPSLKEADHQIASLNSVGVSYLTTGEPGIGLHFFQRCIELDKSRGYGKQLSLYLSNLAFALRRAGSLRQSEFTSRQALAVFDRKAQDRSHEGCILAYIASNPTARLNSVWSEIALKRSGKLWSNPENECCSAADSLLAQRALWLGQREAALPLAERGWSRFLTISRKREFVEAVRIYGSAALEMRNFATAEQQLQLALTEGRKINSIEEELRSLTALAELHRQRKEYDAARELLEQVWAPAERGPYRLWHADALNALAELERDLGHRDAAIEAASAAYRLAWCDGPPYAYHYALTNARRHLHELGTPAPQLPPFDETKFPPMPDVELNPKDEFWVDPNNPTDA